MTDDDLDTLFAAARAEVAQPPAALVARVIADAEATLVAKTAPQAAPSPATSPATRSGGARWSGLAALFGGSGALAGMVTATVAGFWIGFAQPVQLDAMSAVLTGTAAEIDMMPGLDALLDEVP